MKNYNIASTVINEQTRVSSAAIVQHEMFGTIYQYETWIFNTQSLMSRQFIHGSIPFKSDNMEAFARRFHYRIVKVLNKRK